MGAIIGVISQVLLRIKWDKACEILSVAHRWIWSRLTSTQAFLGTFGSRLVPSLPGKWGQLHFIKLVYHHCFCLCGNVATPSKGPLWLCLGHGILNGFVFFFMVPKGKSCTHDQVSKWQKAGFMTGYGLETFKTGAIGEWAESGKVKCNRKHWKS